MEALVLARKAVAAESHGASEGLALVRDLPVTSDSEQAFAADVLRDVKGKHHALDEKRKTITVPINTALKVAANAISACAVTHIRTGVTCGVHVQ